MRVALAALFVPAGLGKFLNHEAYVERFERWGYGAAAGELALLAGAVEVICGLLLLAGVVPRAAALALIGTMLGALATAGRVDGGRDVWLPLVAIAGLAVVARWGAGRWALGSRIARRVEPGRADPAG